MLRHIKDGHHDIKRVGDKSYGYKGLGDPLEEDPCFKAGEVIVINDHLIHDCGNKQFLLQTAGAPARRKRA